MNQPRRRPKAVLLGIYRNHRHVMVGTAGFVPKMVLEYMVAEISE